MSNPKATPNKTRRPATTKVKEDGVEIPQVVESTIIDAKISTFFWDETRYVLKNPIPYTVEEEKGYFTFECSDLNMLSCAKDRETALEQFNEEFASIYDMFTNEPDANLTQDTINLKNKLREMVTVERISQ